ncbi:MAG: UvrD-helicase domain-containing protein [Woeseiaceae bacterium]|nr:UvrD-helicase domain-containing protein [Woeseiaceae bacterium]
MISDAKLLRADQQSRTDALDIERSAIVQAPAGSGKTELLIQRYLKLLAAVQNPEEILAITFTHKAALEMQVRILDALRRAQRREEPAFDYEKTTFAAACEALERDKALDWGLIEAPGRMRIQTVDAFAASIARSLPLTSGLGGITATVKGTEMEAIYEEAAAATFDSLDSDLAPPVECVLTHLDNNTRSYILHLSRMLAFRDQWLKITGGGLRDAGSGKTVRKRLESNVETIVARELKNLIAKIPADRASELQMLVDYAAENLRKGNKVDHPLAAIDTRQGLPGDAAEHRRAWQAISGLLLKQDNDWRRRVNRNDGFPPGDDGQKDSLYALIDRCRDIPGLHESLLRVRVLPEHRYRDSQWEVLQALLQLLPLAAAELRRLFGERGVSDYIEVAQAADMALGSADEPGDIALLLDYRIRHLLIDEMQDTSISQYELLQKLTAGWSPDDGRTLFCVGDPMQSIYRFRNAEVGQFLLARRDGIGNVKPESLVLRQNFRSGEHLVHWFNTIFSQILPTHDDIGRGAIAYSQSVPVEQHADAGEHRVHPLFGADLEEEASYTLGVIRDCLGERPQQNVALLVRSRTILPPLLYELRLANIPYQAVEIDSLTDLPEIIDLLALTRALCHESDRLAWLALLRGPWVGLRWADLHALVKNDTGSTVPELLADIRRLKSLSEDANERLQVFRRQLDEFLRASAHETLRDRVERTWYALGGPAMLRHAEQVDNVYRYLDVIGKIETAGSIADVRALELMLDNEFVSSRFDPDCRLQIMTMHKAKGLQFDQVIIYGLGRRTKQSDRTVLSWLLGAGEDGHSSMILSPVGPRSEVENDPLHQFIESTERDKQRLELDRLLYVACTRARNALHLIGNVSLTAEGDGYRAPSAGTLLHRLWPALESTFESAFKDSGIAEEAGDYADDDYLEAPVLRRLEAAPPSEAPPLPTVVRHEPPGGEAPQVEYHWVGSAARHAGTIVHRWLQRIADAAVDIGDRDAMQQLTRRWAIALGVRADEVDTVCRRVTEAIEKVTADAKGREILFGAGKSELALSGIVDGHLQSVILDRVHIDDNGTHWIVDYKTSSHEGGNLAGFLQQEKDRHRPQLEKYAHIYRNLTDAPVKTALYFPLLQQFVEIET